MSWSTPATVVTGTVITASWGNTSVRDLFSETAPAKVTTQGDTIYATGANTLAKLAIGPANAALISNGSVPQWSAVNQNAATILAVTNTTSGTLARSLVAIGASGSSTQTAIDSFSAGWTASGGGDDVANGSRLLASGAGGLAIRASDAAGTIRFYTGSTLRVTIGTSGVTTFAANITVSSGGITVTGNSTIAGTLGSLTGLTVSGTGNVLVVDTSTLVVDATNHWVGIGTATPSWPLQVRLDQNAATIMGVYNATSGTAARAVLAIGASASSTLVTFDAFSAGYTASGGGDDAVSGGRLLCTGSGGISIRASASGSSASIRFYTGSTKVAELGGTTAGGLQLGSPTGGDKGLGTINTANDQYKNGTAYTNPHGGFEMAYTGKLERYGERMAAMGLPDYQFLTLEEIESFTREHFHFPRMADEDNLGIFGGGERFLLVVEELAVHLFEIARRVRRLEEGVS